MIHRRIVVVGLAALCLSGWAGAQGEEKPDAKVVKTDAEWRRTLTREQYWILRRAGTEWAFRNAFWNNHRKGKYVCAGCDNELFTSETKFDSGTGWPSFFQPARKGALIEHMDPDGERVEVLCARCDGHLGHVFNDGPRPTGLRYCMNSGAMKFIPKK